MQEEIVAYNINFVLNGAAKELASAEGLQSHTISTAPYPCIPIAGDLISWDWLADGKLFIVVSRLFIWDDPRTVTVQLLLDLPPMAPPENSA